MFTVNQFRYEDGQYFVEAGHLEGFLGQESILLDGRSFDLTAIRRDAEDEITGWEYTSEDGRMAVIE